MYSIILQNMKKYHCKISRELSKIFKKIPKIDAPPNEISHATSNKNILTFSLLVYTIVNTLRQDTYMWQIDYKGYISLYSNRECGPRR